MAAPIGESTPRIEDSRFLRGDGRYLSDTDVPDAVHAVIVRSDHAHARITSVDTQSAQDADGVIGVYTVADLQADGVGTLPCVAAVTLLAAPARPALADAVVRHVGDPVAMVVARTQALGQAAAELVQVDYHPLPAAIGARRSLAADAPQVWPDVAHNMAFDFEAGDGETVAAVMRSAAHVVEAQIDNHRVSALPLEPRAGVGLFDVQSGTYWLRCNAQGLHDLRAQLAPLLGVDEDKLQVSAPDVGGGFGLKNFVYPEWVLLLWAARKLGCAVRFEATRAEEMAAAAYGRDLHTVARLALNADGQILALEADAAADMGAYLSGSAPNVSTKAMPTAMGGVYHVPALYLKVRGVFTNTAPTDAYRGAGKPEANFMIERLLAIAAMEHGFDPVALREKNMLRPPYRSPTGTHIKSGVFAGHIKEALARSEYHSFAARREADAAKGLMRGIGMGCFLETSRGVPDEGASVRFLADGTIEIAVGTESHGQGHETALAQIAAAQLGQPMACFRYVQADTRRTRMGHGHGGARTMHMAGLALQLAMDEVIAKAEILAASLLQTEVGSLEFTEGGFRDRVSGASVSLMETAATAWDNASGANKLDSFASHHDTPFTFPNGCHVAEVQVDPETGFVSLLRYTIVDDYGTLINPQLTAGQVHGGVAQGLGQALGEVARYDDAGQLLSGSLMDYWLPRAVELPDFDVCFNGTPADANRLGVKGSGQAGCIAAPQTVVNAVADAVGRSRLQMPLTSEQVWRAIHSRS